MNEILLPSRDIWKSCDMKNGEREKIAKHPTQRRLQPYWTRAFNGGTVPFALGGILVKNLPLKLAMVYASCMSTNMRKDPRTILNCG